MNVAVAWGFAAWVNVVAHKPNTADVRGFEEGWGVKIWRRAGAELCTSFRIARAGKPRTGLTEIAHPEDILPNRGLLTVPSESFLSGGTNRIHKGVSSRGWPLLSMSCEYDFFQRQTPARPVRSIRVSSGITTGAIDPSWIHGPDTRGLPRALPLRPIPRGFAINTIFYAVLLWLLICGPFALRRFLRVNRGLCVKCGYPRGELPVCTECGAELPRSARAIT